MPFGIIKLIRDEPIAGNWTIKVMDTTTPNRVGKFLHWRIMIFAENGVISRNTSSPPTEVDSPAATPVPSPSSGSEVGGHRNGFSVLAIVSIVMCAIFGALYYAHKKGFFRKNGKYDDFSELEQLASIEEGDFDGIALNDLNLPERELIFASIE